MASKQNSQSLELVETSALIEELARRSDLICLVMSQSMDDSSPSIIFKTKGELMTMSGLVNELARQVDEDVSNHFRQKANIKRTEE